MSATIAANAATVIRGRESRFTGGWDTRWRGSRSRQRRGISALWFAGGQRLDAGRPGSNHLGLIQFHVARHRKMRGDCHGQDARVCGAARGLGEDVISRGAWLPVLPRHSDPLSGGRLQECTAEACLFQESHAGALRTSLERARNHKHLHLIGDPVPHRTDLFQHLGDGRRAGFDRVEANAALSNPQSSERETARRGCLTLGSPGFRP